MTHTNHNRKRTKIPTQNSKLEKHKHTHTHRHRTYKRQKYDTRFRKPVLFPSSPEEVVSFYCLLYVLGLCVCLCFSTFAVLCWYLGPFAIVICVCHFLPPVFSGFKRLCMSVSRFVALWFVIWSLCDLYVDVLLIHLFRV
jgi:hypothetical protein